MATAPDEETPLSPKQIHTRLALLATFHLLGMLLYSGYALTIHSDLVDWLLQIEWVPEWLISRLLGEFYPALAWALYTAPPALLAMTIVLPNWSANARIMVATMGVSSLGLAILMVFSFGPDFLQFFKFPLAMLIVAACICILMRHAGYVIRFVPPAERSPTPRPLHFNMAQLLATVAGVAILLGVMRWLKNLDPESLLAFQLQRTIIPYVLELMRILPAVMLPVCAGLARTRVVFWSCLVAVCVVVASGAWVFYYESETPWKYLLVGLFLCYLCLLSTHVVRSCGFRLVRDPGELPSSDSLTEEPLAERTSDGESAQV